MVPSWPSFHRRSVLFIPEAKEARTVPLGASDGEGHLGEAVISLAIPGKAVGHHYHPLRLAIPLPDQDCSGRKFGPLLIEADQRRRHCCTGFPRIGTIKQLSRLVVEVSEAICLDPIGDDRKHQMTGQMIGRWSLQHALPPRPQTFKVETAQMHDLVLNGRFGDSPKTAPIFWRTAAAIAMPKPPPRFRHCRCRTHC